MSERELSPLLGGNMQGYQGIGLDLLIKEVCFCF
jgi:hypothetical protein